MKIFFMSFVVKCLLVVLLYVRVLIFSVMFFVFIFWSCFGILWMLISWKGGFGGRVIFIVVCVLLICLWRIVWIFLCFKSWKRKLFVLMLFGILIIIRVYWIFVILIC